MVFDQEVLFDRRYWGLVRPVWQPCTDALFIHCTRTGFLLARRKKYFFFLHAFFTSELPCLYKQTDFRKKRLKLTLLKFSYGLVQLVFFLDSSLINDLCFFFISQTYSCTHLSAGDLLRAERSRKDSTDGQLIDTYIKEGKIVPVEITINLLRKVCVQLAGLFCILGLVWSNFRTFFLTNLCPLL